MTLIIPQKLIALVEKYLFNVDRKIEQGGYFFGRNNVFSGFLPIPNYAQESSRQYDLGNTRPIADKYAKMLDAEIIADMHTHPNGTVASESDAGYVRNISWPYHVVISDKGSELEWFVVNHSLQSEAYVRNNMELEVYAESIAGETALTYLGQVFLSPKGEIIGREAARKLLMVDDDVLRVEAWFKSKRQGCSWYRPSYAAANRELKMPMPRVKRAFAKMGYG
jgi:proteasome lid subunit RPN8/RPN11